MYRFVGFSANDRRIAVLHIVFWELSVVAHLSERKGFSGELFLKEGISHVPFVGQNVFDGAAVPVRVSVPSWYAVLVEHIGDCLHSEALQVETEYSANYYRLGFVDNHLSVDEIEAVCRAGTVEVA